MINYGSIFTHISHTGTHMAILQHLLICHILSGTTISYIDVLSS